MGSCCIANGSDNVHDALHEALTVTGSNALVKRVGCVGMCHQTPFLEIIAPQQPAVLYSRVRPEHVKTIVRRHFKPNGLAVCRT
ncbi:MAG: (2Fe-2S) ferredoxin domain-containing protein [Phycisphaerae bacterium]|nr:(2Fe-2S) ferredoxin domain-containing protein [Phycisphaerae bacterium]